MKKRIYKIEEWNHGGDNFVLHVTFDKEEAERKLVSEAEWGYEVERKKYVTDYLGRPTSRCTQYIMTVIEVDLEALQKHAWNEFKEHVDEKSPEAILHYIDIWLFFDSYNIQGICKEIDEYAFDYKKHYDIPF